MVLRGGAVLLALVIGLAGHAAATELQSTSPLLLWSNRVGLVGKGSGSQVKYSSLGMGDAQSWAVDAILALLGKGNRAELVPSSTDGEDTIRGKISVVVFVGSELGAAELRKGSAAKLSTVLDASASSLVLPYASCSNHEVSKLALCFIYHANNCVD